MFDQDGDGNISKSEIETIMGGTQIPEQLWKNIINQCDNNSDGEVFYLFILIFILIIFNYRFLMESLLIYFFQKLAILHN